MIKKNLIRIRIILNLLIENCNDSSVNPIHNTCKKMDDTALFIKYVKPKLY